jgi:hypothetical protein
MTEVRYRHARLPPTGVDCRFCPYKKCVNYGVSKTIVESVVRMMSVLRDPQSRGNILDAFRYPGPLARPVSHHGEASHPHQI